MTTKRIAILGSTGSIGTQALNVIRRHKERFAVEVLCAGSNADLLIQQALEFEPNAVAIADESKYPYVSEALQPHGIKVFAGEEAIADLMEETMASDGFNVNRSGNNVWVVSRDYDENRPTLLLNAHLDTVKPVASWTRNPFEAVEEGDRLYGLGSNDCGG